MTEQPGTGSLDYFIRRFANAENMVGGDDLVNALEEAMRLIADLQARVAVLEDSAPDARQLEYEADEALADLGADDRMPYASLEDFEANDGWEDDEEES